MPIPVSYPDDTRPKILFIHIPKCGGLSLYQAFEQIVSPDRCIRFGDNASIVAFYSMREEDFQDYSLVSGHLPFPHFVQKGAAKGRIIVSTVRHPIDRIISAYHYVKNSSHPDHSRFKNINFDQYIDEVIHDPRQRNMQCFLLSGLPDFLATKSVIEEFYSCVCRLESLDLMKEYFYTRFGARLKIPHSNKTETKPVKNSEGNLHGRMIEANCNEDLKLYNYIKDIEHDFSGSKSKGLQPARIS